VNGRLRAQIVKELLTYLRDPRTRLILVGPPLLQLVLFSFAVTLEVRNVDVAVYNEDTGRASQEVLARIAGASFVHRLVPVHRQSDLGAAIDRRDVLIALHVPGDFSRAAAAGRSATIQVLVDGRRANSGQIALAYLQAIVAQLDAELALVPAPELVAVRHWFNPNLIYQWFVVPSLSGILAMFIALVVTGLSIARERELGTFEQLLVSPTQPIEIIVGKCVPALIIGTVLASIMIAAGVLVFRVPFAGSFGLLLASLLLYILSVVGVGLVISSICQTQPQAIWGAFAFGIPVILLSGFATPVENMPDWLQVVAEASPLKHFLIIVQGSFLKGLGPAEVYANAWPMAVIALVTLSSAIVIVGRRLQ